MPAPWWGSQQHPYSPATSNLAVCFSPAALRRSSAEILSTLTPPGTSSSSNTTLWGKPRLLILVTESPLLMVISAGSKTRPPASDPSFTSAAWAAKATDMAATEATPARAARLTSWAPEASFMEARWAMAEGDERRRGGGLRAEVLAALHGPAQPLREALQLAAAAG